MSYFSKTLKALQIYNKSQRWEREKQFAIHISLKQTPDYSLVDKFYKFYVDIIRCGKLKRKFSEAILGSSGFSKHLHGVMFTKAKFMTNGTFENYILKSFIGFICGMILVYMLFALLFVVSVDYTTASYICVVVGLILCLGLAFFPNVRAVTFLILPQFFSRQGRQALMAYALFLAATGPAKNTLHNMNILSDSLSCTQEQLKSAGQNILELIKIPLKALSTSMKRVMSQLANIVQKVKDILISIKRLVLSLMSTIKAAFDWLMQGINFCNKKLGTPYERCMNTLSEATDDCKVQVLNIFSGFCYVTYTAAPVCFSVKWLDYLCDFVDWVVSGETIFGVIKKKLKAFGRHVKTFFYVKISVKHSYALDVSQSKSFDEVAGGILSEIRKKSAFLINMYNWSSFNSVFLFFLLFMLYQVLYYRFRFLSSPSFDNRFITKDFVEIDWRRTLHNQETVLPLNRREKTKYVTLFTAQMAKSERQMFARSAVFLSVSTFKLGIYMLVDYSLYWVLFIIRAHGRVRTNPKAFPISLNVDGEGVVAEIMRSIINSFRFVGAVMNVDTLPCLPDPIPPDIARYKQIFTIIGLTWIFAFCQPFGLRIRHYVMCMYHPDIARERSVWLYNHILRKRSSFVKYMRRELRRKFSKSTNALSAQDSTKVTLKQKLLALFPFLTYFFRETINQKACLICGAYQSEGIHLNFCPTPGCIGTYCDECFKDLDNVCTICKKPIEYGDVSDVSEEKDSSDEEIQKEIAEVQRNLKKSGPKRSIFGNFFRKDNEKNYEEVLPLYRMHPGEVSDTDFSSFSGCNEMENGQSEANKNINLVTKPCRKVNFTSKDIFKNKLPIGNLRWSSKKKHLNKNLNFVSNSNAILENNMESDDTSDDALVKQYRRRNPAQPIKNDETIILLSKHPTDDSDSSDYSS